MNFKRWIHLGTAASVLFLSGQGSAQSTAEEQATARVSDEAFEVVLKPVGKYEAGKAGVAEVVLKANGEYKINDKYPYRFKFSDGEHVRPGGPVVTKDAMRISHKSAVMPLAFTPTAAGQSTVAGEFRFSICTNDRCLVERVDLALTVLVK